MPRTPAQHEAQRAVTRTRLLDAALRQFSDRGYAAASIRHIAEDAGVAHGLVYHYFPSKEAVLLALFERSMADVGGTFAAADAAPPRERVAALVRAAAATVRTQLPFWKLSYGVRMQAAVLDGLGPALGAWTTTITHTLQRYLSDAGVVDADVEATLLFAAIDGMCQHYALDPERYPLDAVAERLIARFVEAP